MNSRVLWSSQDLVHARLPAEQVREGEPTTAVWEAPVADIECGLWEHSVGVSTDQEQHEVFVVLRGRARIEVEGQAPLDVGPGDVVELAAGARTVWHVREPLRKFWVMPG
ncbi:MAG TPA: cupin domain-containing protein [Actinomycetota bacterium]|nr:cupin domain-containing protein [Actinomycetota bacterium]